MGRPDDRPVFDDPGETRSGLPRALLFVPVLAIIAVVAYLFAANPGARDVLEDEPLVATATPAASAAVTTAIITPAPTRPPRVFAPPRDVYRLHDPDAVIARPIPVWRPGQFDWYNGAVEWVQVRPRLWQDGPRIIFLGRDGTAFRFHVDGFREGEALQPEGVQVRFEASGRSAWPRRLRLAAIPSDRTGLDLFVEFDTELLGLIAPTLTVRVSGTMGSKATVRAPFVHDARRPELAYRVDTMIQGLLSERPFDLYLPTGLPDTAVAQWAGRVPGFPQARSITWLVPSDEGWASLLLVEAAGCERSLERPEECFGPDGRGITPAGRLTIGGSEWSATTVAGVRVLFGHFGETAVLLASPDEAAVETAAGSLELFGQPRN
jgi:hypothetical protein